MAGKTSSVAACVTVVVALLAITAGCGGTRSGGDKAAASGGLAGAASGAATGRARVVKFAECMRRNGVSAFPDPDATGALTIDAVANGSSVDTNSALFKHALGACKDLEPSGFTGHQRTPQEQKAALEFAQCVRDNGVRDFPDPSVSQPLVDTNRVPSANKPGGMTILNAAMHRCGQYAAAAGVRGSN
jgi:hypothetical protein